MPGVSRSLEVLRREEDRLEVPVLMWIVGSAKSETICHGACGTERHYAPLIRGGREVSCSPSQGITAEAAAPQDLLGQLQGQLHRLSCEILWFDSSAC